MVRMPRCFGPSKSGFRRRHRWNRNARGEKVDCRFCYRYFLELIATQKRNTLKAGVVDWDANIGKAR